MEYLAGCLKLFSMVNADLSVMCLGIILVITDPRRV